MYRALLISHFALALMVSSCTKVEQDFDAPLTNCIEDIIQNDTTLLNVIAFNTKQDVFYLLKTNASQHDGFEYFISSSCDTVCTSCGECYIPKCVKKILKYDRKLIWTR